MINEKIRKMTEEQAAVARHLREDGKLSYSQIGRIFNVSGETAKAYIYPEYRAERDARMKRRLLAKKASDTKELPNSIKELTLQEVIKKAESGEKTIEGVIHNATVEDLATLNDLFDVTFTVHCR